MKQSKARLILEDGTQLCGFGFGSDKTVMVELVFNTSMVGYQEILSDPSYTDQAVVMTYPLIGNYGMNRDDYESKTPGILGLIVREYNDEPSNFRSSSSLNRIMEKYKIAGISGVDTRKLTRHIRTYGSCKAMITRENEDKLSLEAAVKSLKKTVLPKDAVSRAGTKNIYTVGNEKEAKYHIVLIDCGCKQNILNMLNQKGCFVTAVPWDTDADKILSLNPDAVFISNGPGNPEDVKETIKTIKSLTGKLPIFGICLGHQLICLSAGAKTYKLKFGHRGGNHPVKNLLTDKIEMTSQNHSYAVDEASLQKTELEVTHKNLLDGTVEGIRSQKNFLCSVQYHPESSPGPQDSEYLFDELTAMIKAWKEVTGDAKTYRFT